MERNLITAPYPLGNLVTFSNWDSLLMVVKCHKNRELEINVKKAEGRGQRAEGVQYSVGFRPTLIARHQIEDFGVGLQPLLPSVVAEGRNQNSLLPSAKLPSAFLANVTIT